MRKNLKKFMIDNNLKNNDVSDKLNVTSTYYSAVVSGYRKATLKLMSKFKDAYGIKSMDEVIEIFKDE